MPQAEPLLEIAAVEAVYNHAIVALHEVSLKLHQGEILALLGANGAGKTTTLKALSNLLPAERGAITKGHIRFAGPPRSSVTAWCRCSKAAIAFVP
jgi:branched-chain amino acid transport system ATP-binding protein